MILLIDNYDSFSYNLVQMIGEIDPDITVVRNDEVTVDEIRAMNPSHIVLSPGPGHPKDAGICKEVVRELGAEFPILGVCLGHQAISEAYGATVTLADKLMHGKKSDIGLIGSTPLFAGLPQTFEGARYHSLVAQSDTVPGDLRVVALSQEREVMAVAHKVYPVFGLQFHPESILTPQGSTILKNFLKMECHGDGSFGTTDKHFN